MVPPRKSSLSSSLSWSSSSAASAASSDSSPIVSMYKLKHIQQVDAGLFVFQATRKYKKIFKDHRNMVVLRHSSREITLINPLHLDEEGERKLQAFGNVRHIIRLGGVGGCYNPHHDDEQQQEMLETDINYLKQYPGACIWSASSSYPLSHGVLDEDKPAPLPRMRVFTFRDTNWPEAALLLQRRGGAGGNVLITSEVFQSQKYNRFLNMPTRTAMKLGGFLESTVVISPVWLKAVSPKRGALREEFERLLKLDFSRLIGGSGNLVTVQAKEEAVMAVEIAFPLWD